MQKWPLVENPFARLGFSQHVAYIYILQALATMNKVRTRTTDIFIDESNILHIKVLRNASIDFNDAIESFMTAKNLSKGEPKLILADIRQKRKMAVKARRLFEKENIPAKHIAKAVLINSKLLKNIQNIFVNKNKKFPVRTFTSENEALNWLRTFN
jgi:hypothetical protein